jgi:hypothetical protein
MVEPFLKPINGVIVQNASGREVTIRDSPDTLSELHSKIKLFFGVHNYSLSYIDEDGDKFPIPNEAAYEYAIS